MSYDARAPPADFGDFMAAIADAQANGGVLVDEGLYEEFFAEADQHKGARPEFVAALKRPSADALKAAKANNDNDGNCPVCLQTLAAIVTEEEYALASEHYFGDTTTLGLRVLPCAGAHVVCARCAAAWLRLNNSCPLCRAQLDPSAPVPVDAIENQRHTERMLGLFHSLFGPAGPARGSQTGRDASGHPADDDFDPGVFGRGTGVRREEEDRSAFSGMYS